MRDQAVILGGRPPSMATVRQAHASGERERDGFEGGNASSARFVAVCSEGDVECEEDEETPAESVDDAWGCDQMRSQEGNKWGVF